MASRVPPSTLDKGLFDSRVSSSGGSRIYESLQTTRLSANHYAGYTFAELSPTLGAMPRREGELLLPWPLSRLTCADVGWIAVTTRGAYR